MIILFFISIFLVAESISNADYDNVLIVADVGDLEVDSDSDETSLDYVENKDISVQYEVKDRVLVIDLFLLRTDKVRENINHKFKIRTKKCKTKIWMIEGKIKLNNFGGEFVSTGSVKVDLINPCNCVFTVSDSPCFNIVWNEAYSNSQKTSININLDMGRIILKSHKENFYDMYFCSVFNGSKKVENRNSSSIVKINGGFTCNVKCENDVSFLDYDMHYVKTYKKQESRS